MRIAYISWSVIPSRSANSIQVMKMCQAFAKNGHEVILIARDGSNEGLNVEDIYSFYDVEPCFEIKKVPKLSFVGGGYILSLVATLIALKFRANLVYSRLLPGCFLGSLVGLPTIFECHAAIERAGIVTKYLLPWLVHLKRLNRIVVISNALQHYFQKNYEFPKNLFVVAHDGADEPRKIESCIQFNAPEKLQVGYIGHLYPGKGMEIIAELVKQCAWADFHIIGGLDTDLQYWQEVLKDFKNVIFYGFMPHAQTEQYRQSFDVLLAPYQRKVMIGNSRNSNISEWMSPLKIFEYMASGKAIVCSSLPVLKEVFTDHKTALLCEPDDVNNWIDALQTLRSDSNLEKSLGREARQEFLAKYTWIARAKTVISDI